LGFNERLGPRKTALCYEGERKLGKDLSKKKSDGSKRGEGYESGTEGEGVSGSKKLGGNRRLSIGGGVFRKHQKKGKKNPRGRDRG